MISFLQNVVQDILRTNDNLSECTFVLPSKRAGVFLKKEIKSALTKVSILPRIISIEDFIEDLSNLNVIDTTSLLFEFYSVYAQQTPKEKRDSFGEFSKWAAVVLQDFNEIDRHLIDPSYLFGYLKDIKRIETLLKGENKTTLIENRMLFYERLEGYYSALKTRLLEKRRGYQGLLYREAVENIQHYINHIGDIRVVLVGFNALNAAEEIIFKELLSNDIAQVYWDLDTRFYSTNHNASFFIKKYLNQWKFYKEHPHNWITSHFDNSKNIEIIGAPKNSTQIKYAGELLSRLGLKKDAYTNTAFVLADESLLISALNSLPPEVENVNITMGYDLKNIPIANLFEQFFKLHIYQKNERFYYKSITAFLNQYLLRALFNKELYLEAFLHTISKKNYSYLKKSDIKQFSNAELFRNVSFLFETYDQQPNSAIEACLKLISLIKDKTTLNHLEKEYLYRFHLIFQQLLTLNTAHSYIQDIKTLYQFYKQILTNEKLSFKGEPLSGLQIMGMLETRVLDFETVIITSVNEGILPVGKSDSSIIPFDVKKEVGLPTYQEKDAIFSYHFFRLLQRAKNIYLIYNTESDDYGSGEQSRFLTQLELLKENEIQKYVISPKVIKTEIKNKNIDKDATLMNSLKELAERGFSATALSNYILNPMLFYSQKILRINELTEVEEIMGSATLGTIIHKSLEGLYLPYKGLVLNLEHMNKLKGSIRLEVEKWFEVDYNAINTVSGKNLLMLHVAAQFITNFVNSEIDLIKKGHSIQILELEHDLETNITVDGLDFPIKLIGQADRIDQIDGVTRIIDYKTGKVVQSQLIIKDWQLITSDYKKYSKSFQVLFYALLYTRSTSISLESEALESGIISFKNLKPGFLKVNRSQITNEDIENFSRELKGLLFEIFDKNAAILEKELLFN